MPNQNTFIHERLVQHFRCSSKIFFKEFDYRVGNIHEGKKRVKLFAYYLRKGGISGASICVKTVAERAKNELCIKSWGVITLLILEMVSKIKLTI